MSGRGFDDIGIAEVSKYTPGPLIVQQLDPSGLLNALTLLHGEGVYVVGTPTPTPDYIMGTVTMITLSDSETAKANAYLYAAAPEMKKALEEILEGLGQARISGYDMSKWPKHLQDARVLAHVAIAKARGEA